MPSSFSADAVRSLPKAELHVHLEGSVGAETLLALAAEHGVDPPAPDVDGVRRWYDFRDFEDFLERYVDGTAALPLEEALEAVGPIHHILIITFAFLMGFGYWAFITNVLLTVFKKR